MGNEILKCWEMLLQGIIWLGWKALPHLAAYGVLYAVTAAIFLLSLRIKSEDGKLVVKKDSLAFFLAHPLSKYYGVGSKIFIDGEMRLRYSDSGSICAFYIRLFHTLILIWPFLLLYCFSVYTAGNVIALLFAGSIIWVDFKEEGFYGHKEVIFLRSRNVPGVVYAVPATLAVLAVLKFHIFVAFLKTLAIGLVCVSPIVVVIAVGVVVSVVLYRAKEGDAGTVSAFKEFMVNKKDRFCSMVEFK